MEKKDKKVLGKKIKRCLEGNVVISTICYHHSFQIILKISKNISKGSKLSEKNSKVHFNLVIQKNVTQDIVITREVSYKKDLDGTIKPIDIKIPYTKNTFVKGVLIVSPELYLTLGMQKYAQLNQATKQFSFIEIHPRRYQPSPSKFIPYTTCQPNHFYRG